MSRRSVARLTALLVVAVLTSCSSTTPEAAPGGGGGPSPTTDAAPPSPAAAREPGDERFDADHGHGAEASVRLSALLDDAGVIPTEALVRWWATFEPVEGVAPLPADEVGELDIELLLRGLYERSDVPPAVRAQVTAMFEAARTGTTPIGGTGTDDGTGGGAEPVTAETTTTTSVPVGDGGPAGMRSFTPAHLPSVGAVAGSDAEMLTQAGAEGVVAEIRAQLERELGMTISLPLYVHIADAATINPIDGELVLPRPSMGAVTVGSGAADRYARCDTYLRSDVSRAESSAAWFRSAVAHELFHCHQYGVVGSIDTYNAVPQWITEGQAAWVGEHVSGGSPWSTIWWPGWLTEPGKALQRRSYDAIALYWLVERVDAHPEAAFDRMLLDPPGAFAAIAGTNADAIRDLWARSLANESSWGEPWALTGKRVPAGGAVRVPLALAPGSAVAPTATQPLRFSASVFALDASTDLLYLTSGASDRGAVRFAGGEVVDLRPGLTVVCLTGTACAPCPTGPPPGAGGTEVTASQGGAVLALNLLDEPSGVSLRPMNRADVCGSDPVSGDTADICTTLTDDEVAAVMGSPVSAEAPLRDGGCSWDTRDGGMYEVSIYPTTSATAAADFKDLWIVGPDLRWSPIGLGDIAAQDPNPKASQTSVDISFGGVGSGHQFAVKVWNAPAVDDGDAIALMATLLDRI